MGIRAPIILDPMAGEGGRVGGVFRLAAGKVGETVGRQRANRPGREWFRGHVDQTDTGMGSAWGDFAGPAHLVRALWFVRSGRYGELRTGLSRIARADRIEVCLQRRHRDHAHAKWGPTGKVMFSSTRRRFGCDDAGRAKQDRAWAVSHFQHARGRSVSCSHGARAETDHIHATRSGPESREQDCG